MHTYPRTHMPSRKTHSRSAGECHPNPFAARRTPLVSSSSQTLSAHHALGPKLKTILEVHERPDRNFEKRETRQAQHTVATPSSSSSACPEGRD